MDSSTDKSGDRRQSFNIDTGDVTAEGGPGIRMSAQATKYMSRIAALFIIIHNAVRFSEFFFIKHSEREHPGKAGWNMTQFEELRPQDLARRWEMRRSTYGWHITDEIAGIIGWMCVLPVASIATRLVSRGNPTSFVQWSFPCLAFAVLIRLLEWTFNMGQRGGADWVSKFSAMSVDEQSKGVQLIQVLEISYMMARFRDNWFYALDWLFIGTGTGLLSIGSLSQGLLTRKHAYMGFAICGLGILQWITDLLRLSSWFPWVIIGGLTRLMVGTILFPIYIVWFGNILASYKQRELSSLLG